MCQSASLSIDTGERPVGSVRQFFVPFTKRIFKCNSNSLSGSSVLVRSIFRRFAGSIMIAKGFRKCLPNLIGPPFGVFDNFVCDVGHFEYPITVKLIGHLVVSAQPEKRKNY